jgi:hypothetical protein
MSIKLTCKCGKVLSVPDDAAGRRARCPACNAVVPVPGAAPEPPPGPEAAGPSGRVDQVVDAFVSDLERSRERSPQVTQIAMALLIWSGASLVLTFIASLGSYGSPLAYWFLVYLPISLAGALVGLGTIKNWPWTPKAMEIASLAVAGASYALFWQAAMWVGGWASAFFLLVNIVNLGGFAFLNWYYRGRGVAAHFAVDAQDASEGAPEGAPASTKGNSST